MKVILHVRAKRGRLRVLMGIRRAEIRSLSAFRTVLTKKGKYWCADQPAYTSERCRGILLSSYCQCVNSSSGVHAKSLLEQAKRKTDVSSSWHVDF